MEHNKYGLTKRSKEYKKKYKIGKNDKVYVVSIVST